MANTFLNTNRVVSATNNPVENVNQVSNSPINQVQSQPQVQSQIQPQQSPINPITIPIQIQPQVATTSNNVQQPMQQNNGLQQTVRNNNVQAAPTPQEYKQPTNNNIVDFNQIYSNYQNQFGNKQQNNNFGSSGIKKTSFGSTIVTPTTSNLNSIQGQYQSAYSDTINSLIGEMISQISNGFEYDPTTDEALKVATEYASNSTLQSLAGSGVLNSSATAERVARVVSELIPEYEKLAYTRWSDNLGRLADTAQLVMNYDSQQFEYWKDAKDREFQNKQFEYQKKQDELNNAWKRVDELGYVDNKASTILGVPVGTLSGEARLAKEQQEYELAKMREQLEIQRANDEALYKLRHELDKEYANYEYTLASKYGSSNSSSGTKTNYTSLSTYQDIINNRWADKDLMTDKYSVSDNDAVYNYITSEYAAGRMSASDLANLSAMYGITVPGDDNDIIKQREAYVESLLNS